MGSSRPRTTQRSRWLRLARSSVRDPLNMHDWVPLPVGARERTDTALLTEVIEVNAEDGEFFVRKAIGWALRDLAKTDPQWVRRFLAEHELSPLSRREAAKHLD